MRKLVSILIPAYNSEKWISQTIESAINQTWEQKEIIVVDDGSTDKTYNILNNYKSEKVKIIRQENMGAPAARNKALSIAQGDYIQWLDHDDVLAPNKISEQIKESEGGSDSRVLLSSAFGTFYYKIERAKFLRTSIWKDLTPIEYFLYKFEENAWFQPGAWLVSRNLTDLAGPYYEKRSPDDDGEYFCRIVAVCERIKFVQKAIAYWRVGNFSSLSQQRSDESLNILYVSTVRSINTLISLENSERTRMACVKFLQYRMNYFYPERTYIIEKANKLAFELGGRLYPPEMGVKFDLIEAIFGWEMAIKIKEAAWKVETVIRREWDWFQS